MERAIALYLDTVLRQSTKNALIFINWRATRRRRAAAAAWLEAAAKATAPPVFFCANSGNLLLAGGLAARRGLRSHNPSERGELGQNDGTATVKIGHCPRPLAWGGKAG
jgi:hypothetical protein